MIGFTSKLKNRIKELEADLVDARAEINRFKADIERQIYENHICLGDQFDYLGTEYTVVSTPNYRSPDFFRNRQFFYCDYMLGGRIRSERFSLEKIKAIFGIEHGNSDSAE